MTGNRVMHGRASSIDSQTHNIKNGWGIKVGGLAIQTGTPVNHRSNIEKNGTNKIVIPRASGPALAYMMGLNPNKRYMLSRNPQCSGGIGRRLTIC